MEIQVGKQSLAFAEAPYIISSASIVGKKEGEGPLGNRFDVVGEDDKFGQNTWEEAESTLQKEAFTLAVGKAGLKTEDIRYLFSGICSGRTLRHPSGSWTIRCRCSDFMERAAPVAKRSHWARCAWRRGMRIMLWR